MLMFFRLQQISQDALLKFTGVNALENITTLDLHGNGLARLKGLNALTQLKTLVVSFNALSRLDDVAHMVMGFIYFGWRHILK